MGWIPFSLFADKHGNWVQRTWGEVPKDVSCIPENIRQAKHAEYHMLCASFSNNGSGSDCPEKMRFFFALLTCFTLRFLR